MKQSIMTYDRNLMFLQLFSLQKLQNKNVCLVLGPWGPTMQQKLIKYYHISLIQLVCFLLEIFYHLSRSHSSKTYNTLHLIYDVMSQHTLFVTKRTLSL